MGRRGAGWRSEQVKLVGRGASNANVRPPRRRRRVERGGRCAREREGRGSGPRCLAGPKGRRSAQQHLSPFSFFLNFFFSKKVYMRLLKLLQNFSGFGVKRRIVSHKIPYNFALRSEAKFQIEFESQIKTSSRFLNKFILGIFV